MKRRFRKAPLVGGFSPAVPPCWPPRRSCARTRAYAQTPTLRVGHVSPRTGPLAGFAEADDYVLDAIQQAFGAGIENNGKSWAVEIISKDSQSNPNRAAEVAADLILGDEVDIIVAASTPDTTNPVADQAEDQRGALHHHRLPVAALFLRPQRRAGRGVPVRPTTSSGGSKT